MKRIGLALVFFFTCLQLQAQVPEFDQLEMYYAQRHYKVVYRRAKRLLDNPEFDYSWVPEFYKSLSMFHLNGKGFWGRRHPDAIKEASGLFLQIQQASDGQRVLDAHMHEVAALKSDLLTRLGEYKRTGKQTEFEQLQRVIAELFNTVPAIEENTEESNSTEITTPVTEVEKENTNENNTTEFTFDINNREEIIAFSKQYIGVPYQWAGTTPSGFDCSGFTSYIFNAYHKQLPRRAADQYSASKKIKKRKVQKGDLVFFDHGSGIAHVGLIISKKGESPIMIHASTSKGIMVTDVEQSSYWSKRVAGFGSVIE